MIEKNLASPNILQRVIKQIQSLAHGSQILAHMSAFALTDAVWMIERRANDKH